MVKRFMIKGCEMNLKVLIMFINDASFHHQKVYLSNFRIAID